MEKRLKSKVDFDVKSLDARLKLGCETMTTWWKKLFITLPLCVHTPYARWWKWLGFEWLDSCVRYANLHIRLQTKIAHRKNQCVALSSKIWSTYFYIFTVCEHDAILFFVGSIWRALDLNGNTQPDPAHATHIYEWEKPKKRVNFNRCFYSIFPFIVGY